MDILIDHVSKSFGGIDALCDVTAAIEPGQIVALLGPNGAGKTTLLRCLAGIVAPRRGKILYGGERFHRGRIDLRKRFAFLPDFPFVFPDMTALRHIGMVLRLYEAAGPGIEDTVVELLEAFDLLPHAHKRFDKLSRGQAYKAALAAIIAVDPELWLLDEPFASGMDPNGILELKRRARAASERGHTVIYSTQILDVAEAFCDRFCVLHQGRVHAFDSVECLRAGDAAQGSVLEGLFERLRERRA